jgi:nucleotide-binding universal stress UspA family protein
MFQHILVPLDGSKRAERAIHVAARIARASTGEVILLRVVGPPLEFSTSSVPSLPSASAQMLIEGERTEASSYLARLVMSKELVDVATAREVVAGSPAAAILSVAHGQPCDLIVLCRHGYTTSTHWTMGSVAEKIVRHARLPVLLLSEEGSLLVRSDHATQRPLSVLVPLDGSLQAEAVLLPAISLVRALVMPTPVELHLMQVVKLPSTEDEHRYRAFTNAEMREQARRDASAYLAALADRLHKDAGTECRQTNTSVSLASLPNRISITWSVAFAVDVAEMLVRTAANEGEATDTETTGDYSLIVLAAFGRGGVPDWLLGNVTERVLRASKTPLLIVR